MAFTYDPSCGFLFLWEGAKRDEASFRPEELLLGCRTWIGEREKEGGGRGRNLAKNVQTSRLSKSFLAGRRDLMCGLWGVKESCESLMKGRKTQTNTLNDS